MRPNLSDILMASVLTDSEQTGRVRPSLSDVLLARSSKWHMHVHVRVLPIAEVPKDEEDLRIWLFKLFGEC